MLLTLLGVQAGCPTFDVFLGASDPGSDAGEGDLWEGDTVEPDGSGDAAAVEPEACLQASTHHLDFGLVPASTTRELTLRNNCDGPVTVHRFVLAGSSGFSVSLAQGVWGVTPESATGGVALTTPVTLAAGDVMEVEVAYQVSSFDPAHGHLVWKSDDAEVGLGLAVKLSANVHQPCLVTSPKQVGFGGAVIGDSSRRQLVVGSCSQTVDLQVQQIRLESTSGSGTFSVVGAALVDDPGSGAWPWILDDGRAAQLTLQYEPADVAPIGPIGQPEPDTAVLVIESDRLQGDYEVRLAGFGAAEPCPHAVISAGTPAIAEPGDLLRFDGKSSYGVGSSIASWTWVGISPGGLPVAFASTCDPSDASSSGCPVVDVQVEATGTWDVRLVVHDEEGRESCTAAVHTVEVVPAPALFVELLWVTPGDPDPLDAGADSGTDLDLHLVHPFANTSELDGWFDDPFDVSWHNPAPNWASISDIKSQDDPWLDRDDRDGWGPERIILTDPELEVAYRVGVHYWDDEPYGASTPTVRVWLEGQLVAEVEGPELIEGQLWSVGEVRPGLGDFVVHPLPDGPLLSITPAELTESSPPKPLF